jgi:ribosomal protein S18 acetylase RimI-like enzyme
MTVEIRSATMRDYDAICALLAQVDALHRSAQPDQFAEAVPAREKAYLQSWLDTPDKQLWVAERDNAVVGLVMFYLRQTPDVPILVPRRFIQLDTLVVDAKQQRQGIGETLMQATHQWGRERGIRDIELGVWAFNEAAMAFYRRLGYEALYHKMALKLDEMD